MYISKVYLYFGKFGEEMKIMSHLNNKSRFRESWFSVILLNYKNDYSIIQFKIIRYNGYLISSHDIKLYSILKPEAEDQLNILQQYIAVFKRPCTETLYYSVHVFPLILFLCIN